MGNKSIKKIAVIGGYGQMGRQIGLNSAINGIDSYLYDMSSDAYEKAKKWVDDYLKGRIAKGKLTEEEVEKTLENLHFTSTLKEAVEDADLIIEAIIEDKKIKEGVFKQLSEVVKPDTILATNSSNMVSSAFKDVVTNPERLANLHYFNPALVMKCVEIVQGLHTSEDTVQRLVEFVENIGKKPVVVRKEIDGFIVNRILRAITNEALYLLEEGVATPEDIDTAVENGLNHPMGPYKIMDFSGLDTCYLVAKSLLDETGFKKPGLELLKDKYESKEWGVKTGKGWYEYAKK